MKHQQGWLWGPASPTQPLHQFGWDGSEGELSQGQEPACVSSLPCCSHRASWTPANVWVERTVVYLRLAGAQVIYL